MPTITREVIGVARTETQNRGEALISFLMFLNLCKSSAVKKSAMTNNAVTVACVITKGFLRKKAATTKAYAHKKDRRKTEQKTAFG